MRPDVDVVIPVRNGGALLRTAVESVIDQDGVTAHVIVVDDGSTDAAPQRLPRHPRIQVIRSRGRGIPTALNTGIEAGTAPFVARQDADDESLPGRLAAQLEHLTANEAIGIVGTAFEVVIGSRTISVMSPQPRRMLDQNPFCAGSVTARREVVVAAGCYREHFVLSSDYDMWLRCAELAGISILPLVGYRYRLTADMSTVRSASRQGAYADLARVSARARLAGGPDPIEHQAPLPVDVAVDADVAAWWAREFAAFGAWSDVLSCLRRLPARRALAVGGSLLRNRAPQASWT